MRKLFSAVVKYINERSIIYVGCVVSVLKSSVDCYFRHDITSKTCEKSTYAFSLTYNLFNLKYQPSRSLKTNTKLYAYLEVKCFNLKTPLFWNLSFFKFWTYILRRDNFLKSYSMNSHLLCF